MTRRPQVVRRAVTDRLGRTRRALGLTTSGAALAGAAGGGAVLARQLRSRQGLLVVYGLVLALVIIWLAQRRPLAVAGRRTAVPTRMRAGQAADVQIELRVAHALVDAVVIECLPPELGGPVRMPVAELTAGATIELGYRLTPSRRGVHRIGPLTVTRNDPFGLVTRRRVVSGSETVIVHPPVERVHDHVASRFGQDPPIRPPTSEPGPSGFDFSGARQYAPGDDLRRVVWRATARMVDGATGEPLYMVRESERGVTDQVRLVVDTDVERHSPGEPSDTFENAVRVTASLGVHHLQAGSSVSLEVNERCLLAGLHGGRARIRFLDQLAELGRCPVPLATALRRISLLRGAGNVHTVVVTAHVDCAVAALLRALTDRGMAVLVVHLAGADPDGASRHRVLATGCRVVEMEAGQATDSAFHRVVAGSTGRGR